jgi:hypothetical protein
MLKREATNYSVEILSMTHPDAHCPKVAVTLTTEPYPLQLSEPSVPPSISQLASTGATDSLLNTQEMPIFFLSRGAWCSRLNR